MTKKDKKNQAGVVIIFTVLMLGILVSVALAVSAILVPKIRLSSDVKNSVGAAFAAESGVEWCLFNNLNSPSPTPSPPTMSNGATFQVTPSDCSGKKIKSVGSFKSVQRSFEADF